MKQQINENRAECSDCHQVLISEDEDVFVACKCGQLKIGGGKERLLRTGKFIERTKFLLNESLIKE